MNAKPKMLDMMYETIRLLLARGVHTAIASLQAVFRKMKGAYLEATGRHAGGTSRFLDGIYTNHAGTRNFKLYIPSGYRGQALPLVVMLHGCKQDPDDFSEGTRMNVLAEEKQFLVVYPAQTSGANEHKCWNWFKVGDQQRDQGEPSLIAGITRQIIDTYHVDTRRVYIAGLSSGGSMAVIMGTIYPDLYAATGVHSGLAYAGAHDLYSALIAMRIGAGVIRRHRAHPAPIHSARRAVSMIVFHGDRDTTFHPNNGDQVMAQNTFNSDGGLLPIEGESVVEQGQVPDGHAYTRTVHNDRHGHGVAEQWLVHGAGHAWSGGSGSGSFTDPKGPDATREMQRFFYAQSRSGQ